MELSKTKEVYVVSGNCDTLWEDIKYELDDENLLRYMIFRKNSILNEMCQELSIEVNEKSDIKHIKEEIKQNFSYELNWLEQLPHIIEIENFIFAHAGITSDNLEEQIINDNGKISFDALDGLPKGEIIENQASNSNTIQIPWMNNAVEVLKEDKEFSLCRHKPSNHEIWIQNNKLYKAKDGIHCYDCTDYFVSVLKGDIVSIIEKASNQTLVKKDGTIGWVLNEKLRLVE